MGDRGAHQGFRIRWYDPADQEWEWVWSVDYQSIEEAMEEAETAKNEMANKGKEKYDYQIMYSIITYDSRYPLKKDKKKELIPISDRFEILDL